MSKFNPDRISIDTIFAVQNHLRWTAESLYFGGAEIVPNLAVSTSPAEQSPLRERIELLCKIANGDYVDNPHIVAKTIQSVCETLFTTAYGSYQIPNSFWQTALGQVIQHCCVWLHGDELITISEAARLLYADTSQRAIMRVQRLLKRGDLQRFIDPDEPNPQRATRVLRSEVEVLKNGQI
jgi:hypothetical protein